MPTLVATAQWWLPVYSRQIRHFRRDKRQDMFMGWNRRSCSTYKCAALVYTGENDVDDWQRPVARSHELVLPTISSWDPSAKKTFFGYFTRRSQQLHNIVSDAPLLAEGKCSYTREARWQNRLSKLKLTDLGHYKDHLQEKRAHSTARWNMWAPSVHRFRIQTLPSGAPNNHGAMLIFSAASSHSSYEYDKQTISKANTCRKS